MTDDPYAIEREAPKIRPRTPRLNIGKLKKSLGALAVGDAFTIPSVELIRTRTGFRTSPFTARIHHLARRLGMKVSTKKQADGLKVRREQ